ncbi:hypothetical protein PVAND_008494 [Polypedilum vanderplanki]|uniref:CHK kinase-like domain-containing protein n=1 Tax=Polypedilum vanderplanki TaxID=319348 RepID=A0A9J6CA55_POLVA|nr:hypothetical protein PVAND_008494 [Polypedilum vanderplanki]
MSSRDEQSISFLNSDTVNDDFFIEIVENALNITRDKFKLKLVLLSPATGKNNNYVSVVYRAKIKIKLLESNENKSIDVIIKALLTTIKEFKEFSVFPRERFMYEDIVQSFEEIWYNGTGEKIQFGPKSIKFETEPYEIIVLEDLKAMKYEMLERTAGLTLEQTKLLLSKLAKFHASSVIRYRKDGIIQKYLDRKASMPPMDRESPFAASFIRMHNEFIKALRSYGDCDIYADKIAKWSMDKMLVSFLEVAEPTRSGFVALNHGDLWLNNMMFKFDEKNNPIDVIMYDYQGSFWASPATDVLYFIISSVSDDIKIDHFDNLIEHYHHELSDSLKRLRYDKHITTLPELFIDFMEKGHFAALCLMFILFIVKYDSQEEITLEAMMGLGDQVEESIVQAMYTRIYGNETYKKAVKLWLPFLNKRGFLDTLLPNEE